MGQHGSAWVSMGQHGSAWVSMGQRVRMVGLGRAVYLVPQRKRHTRRLAGVSFRTVLHIQSMLEWCDAREMGHAKNTCTCGGAGGWRRTCQDAATPAKKAPTPTPTPTRTHTPTRVRAHAYAHAHAHARACKPGSMSTTQSMDVSSQ